jgi:arsenate reductase
MAEGLLASFDPRLAVVSAGTKPAERVHALAVETMREVGNRHLAGVSKIS